MASDIKARIQMWAALANEGGGPSAAVTTPIPQRSSNKRPGPRRPSAVAEASQGLDPLNRMVSPSPSHAASEPAEIAYWRGDAKSHSRQSSYGGGFGSIGSESLGWQTPPRDSRQNSFTQSNTEDSEEDFNHPNSSIDPETTDESTPRAGPPKLKRLQTSPPEGVIDSIPSDDQMSSSSHTTSSGATTLKRLSTGDEDSPILQMTEKTPTLNAHGTINDIDGDQTTDELHFLFTLANNLSCMVAENRDSTISHTPFPDPSSPSTANPASLSDTKQGLMAKVTHATNQIRGELSRTRDLDRRIQETEKRLKARDEYLQNTIMDTARRVQELEQLTADLGSRNEELESELQELRRDKNALESELVDLEEDHLALQNEIVAGEVVGVLSGPPTAGIVSKDADAEMALMGVGDMSVLDHNILDDYVLLRDIETQTDDELWLHAAMSAPSSGVVRARSVSSSSSTSTFSIDGYTSMNATSSSPPPPLSASPSKQERRLLSLSSKLSYASLIASTQSETIRELESLLAKRETEVERLTASIAELGFRAEHSGVMGQTRDRAIDELTKRIQALEAERSAWHLNRRSMLGTPQPESPRDRPASLQYAPPSSPSVLSAPPLHPPPQLPLPTPPATAVPIPQSSSPSNRLTSTRLMGLDELYTTLSHPSDPRASIISTTSRSSSTPSLHDPFQPPSSAPLPDPRSSWSTVPASVLSYPPAAIAPFITPTSLPPGISMGGRPLRFPTSPISVAPRSPVAPRPNSMVMSPPPPRGPPPSAPLPAPPETAAITRSVSLRGGSRGGRAGDAGTVAALAYFQQQMPGLITGQTLP